MKTLTSQKPANEMVVGDFFVGKRFSSGESAPRSLEEHKLFCALTKDQNEIHWNTDVASRHGLREPLMPGMLILSMAVGVLTSYLPTGVQLRGVDSVKFREKALLGTQFIFDFDVSNTEEKARLVVFRFRARSQYDPSTVFVDGKITGILPEPLKARPVTHGDIDEFVRKNRGIINGHSGPQNSYRKMLEKLTEGGPESPVSEEVGILFGQLKASTDNVMNTQD